jgi:hypothetical protein
VQLIKKAGELWPLFSRIFFGIDQYGSKNSFNSFALSSVGLIRSTERRLAPKINSSQYTVSSDSF